MREKREFEIYSKQILHNWTARVEKRLALGMWQDTKVLFDALVCMEGSSNEKESYKRSGGAKLPNIYAQDLQKNMELRIHVFKLADLSALRGFTLK